MNVGIDKYEYLKMCKAMGTEPVEDEIPPDTDDFLFDTLVVFNIYSLLKDDWDTFNGNYLGKYLDTLPMLYSMFEVEKEKQVIYFSLLNVVIYENISIMQEKTTSKELIAKSSQELIDEGEQ